MQGRCVGIPHDFGFNNKLDYLIHIFYLKSKISGVNIIIRAHEEFHAAEALGWLDFVAAKILNKQNVDIDFNLVSSEDVRAYLGSIYALYSRNIDPIFLYKNYFNMPNFYKAYEFYELFKCPW